MVLLDIHTDMQGETKPAEQSKIDSEVPSVEDTEASDSKEKYEVASDDEIFESDDEYDVLEGDENDAIVNSDDDECPEELIEEEIVEEIMEEEIVEEDIEEAYDVEEIIEVEEELLGGQLLVVMVEEEVVDETVDGAVTENEDEDDSDSDSSEDMSNCSSFFDPNAAVVINPPDIQESHDEYDSSVNFTPNRQHLSKAYLEYAAKAAKAGEEKGEKKDKEAKKDKKSKKKEKEKSKPTSPKSDPPLPSRRRSSSAGTPADRTQAKSEEQERSPEKKSSRRRSKRVSAPTLTSDKDRADDIYAEFGVKVDDDMEEPLKGKKREQAPLKRSSAPTFSSTSVFDVTKELTDNDIYEAFGIFFDDEEPEPNKSKAPRKSSKERSRSKNRSSSKKESESKSRSRTRSSSQSKVKKDDGSNKKVTNETDEKEDDSNEEAINEMELKEEEAIKEATDETEVNDAIEDDLEAGGMAELSALEAELNRTIEKFTQQNTPKQDSSLLRESIRRGSMLENSNRRRRHSLDPPGRHSLAGMKLVKPFTKEVEPPKENVSVPKESPRLGLRSRSKIHLLEKEQESDRKSRRRGYGSLPDLGNMSFRINKSSAANATWDKTPESSRLSKQKSTLFDLLNAEIELKESTVKEPSLNSDNLTDSTKSDHPSTPKRASLMKTHSISKLMSYSAFDDATDDDSVVTSQMKKQLASARLSQKSGYKAVSDKEKPEETPTSRRQRMMQMGGTLRHSLRDLTSDDNEEVGDVTPVSSRRRMNRHSASPSAGRRSMTGKNAWDVAIGDKNENILTPRRRMMTMGGLLRSSSRDLAVDDNDEVQTPGGTTRRKRISKLGGLLRNSGHSPRDLGVEDNNKSPSNKSPSTPGTKVRRRMLKGGALSLSDHSPRDLGVDDNEGFATPVSRRRRLKQLVDPLPHSDHSPKDLQVQDKEENVETPGTRRRRMMQKAGRMRNSDSNLNVEEDAEIGDLTPSSARKRLLKMSDLLKNSSRE